MICCKYTKSFDTYLFIDCFLFYSHCSTNHNPLYIRQTQRSGSIQHRGTNAAFSLKISCSVIAVQKIRNIRIHSNSFGDKLQSDPNRTLSPPLSYY